MEIKQRVKNFIATFFKVSSDEVTSNSVASDIAGWDSLSHAELLLAIENEFAISFDLGDLMRMNNVGDLVSVIQCKL